MSSEKTNVLKRSVIVILSFVLSVNLFAQDGQHERPNVAVGSNCNGYLEYLPTGYTGGSASYPLLINIMGFGTTGNGTQAELEALYDIGGGNPHEQAHQGVWPNSFTVNGQSFQFVVITPQFIQNMLSHIPTAAEVDEVVTYAVQHYRIDTSRIYVIGSSQGAGAVWNYVGESPVYARRIAAVIPFAGVSWPIEEKANIIKYSAVAVWGFHNLNDESVPAYFTQNYIDFINESPAPPVEARKTIFNASGHLCWYDPLERIYTEGGLNVYQWLLQFQKNFTKAHAGYYQEITLPTNSAQLNGTGSGPNGTSSAYLWQKVSGPSGSSFSSTTIKNPTVNNLSAGSYAFRFTITDNIGGQAADTVRIKVNPPRQRIEAENYSAISAGIVTRSTSDEGGGTKLDEISQDRWADYTINVSVAGNYKFKFRIGSFYSKCRLTIKNSSGTDLASAEVFSTGEWDSLLTETLLNVPLQAGTQTIRIQSSSTDYPNNVWYFNWFEIEQNTSLLAPLPANFVLFNANCVNNSTALNWRTVGEINSSEFVIEKSTDARTWKEIGRVSAAGQTSAEQNYYFTDRLAGAGDFYRIAQQDRSGKKTFTSILKSNCGGEQTFAVFPNPVNDKTILNISSGQSTRLNLSMVDNKGVVVRMQQTILPQGNSQVTVNFAGLAKGIYNLRAEWNGEIKTTKILKN
jgi:predicted esterase